MRKIIFWLLKLIVAGFILQTVFVYKFPAHPESVELFTKISRTMNFMIPENYLRIGTGVLEILASIMLLIPKTTKVGAFMTLGLLLGAVFLHIFVIGLDKLFYTAIFLFILTILILKLRPKIYHEKSLENR